MTQRALFKDQEEHHKPDELSMRMMENLLQIKKTNQENDEKSEKLKKIPPQVSPGFLELLQAFDTVLLFVFLYYSKFLSSSHCIVFCVGRVNRDQLRPPVQLTTFQLGV